MARGERRPKSRKDRLMQLSTVAMSALLQPVKLDYVWASLCIVGAVYFIFRG